MVAKELLGGLQTDVVDAQAKQAGWHLHLYCVSDLVVEECLCDG